MQCGNRYSYQRSLKRHAQYECGKIPRFQCANCAYRTHHKNHLQRHYFHIHNQQFE